jgi:hypothetical protein
MNYYKKYLKYKSKYLLIKNQIGGEPIDNYFTTFFGITNDETLALNCFLKPILDQYWAEISICYGLPSPDHFIFKFVVNHPMEVNKYRENIVVFLSDHSPIHDERGRNNIISWNVGIGDEETVFNYLRPIECKKTGDAPGGKKVSVCPWFIKGQACHTRPGQPCSLRHPESFFFKKPAIDSPSDLKLLELKARLIVEYIKYYKGDKTIVHLQECSGRLYKKICDLLVVTGEYFSSNFNPQTLIYISEDLSTVNSFYTMSPESHNKSGLCTFVFFPSRENIKPIRLIPTNLYLNKEHSGVFKLDGRGCKVKGLETITNDTIYNVHLKQDNSHEDQKTLFDNTNSIFDLTNLLKINETFKQPSYERLISKLKETIQSNVAAGNQILVIRNKNIVGNDVVSTIVGSKIIIAGDFNQKNKKITRESFTWAKNKESNIDYILYADILPEDE